MSWPTFPAFPSSPIKRGTHTISVLSQDETETAPRLEAPHNLGRLPRGDYRDWRREDRERLRSGRTAGQLTALVLVPLVLIAFTLTATGAIKPPPAWVAFGVMLVAAAAIWFLRIRFHRASRNGSSDPGK